MTTQPYGWHTITPRIVARDPKRLVEFIRTVFQGSGEFHSERPTEVRIGDSIVMVSGDGERDPMPAFLYVYVDDTEATYERALASGATSLEPPARMPYGDRRAMVRDAWDNTWQIAHRVAERVCSTLVLFPTELERGHAIGEDRYNNVVAEICGFGPVAAAARTSQLLGRLEPHQVILVGIAGTYDEQRLPVGTATTFDEVVLDGVGAGQGERFEDASAFGFAQWPGSPDTCDRPVGERLSLEPLESDVRIDTTTPARVLVTACAASATPSEAAARSNAHPGALAEDMEAFGVALACRLHQVPVSVVRGISNLAGDRERSRWQVETALRDAGKRLGERLDRAHEPPEVHR